MRAMHAILATSACASGLRIITSRLWPGLAQAIRAVYVAAAAAAWCRWVDLYKKDDEKFFADFASAFSKLLELGVPFPEGSKAA